MENVLKIEVTEKVDTIDTFLTYSKEWIRQKAQVAKRTITHSIVSEMERSIKNNPVRGPDSDRMQILNRIKNYAI